MHFKNLPLLVLCFIAKIVCAQNANPQISIRNTNFPICSYSETKIAAEITGKFNTDNKFFVSFFDTDRDTAISRYEATYRNGYFHFTIGDDRVEKFSRVDVMVTSTSPVVSTGKFYSQFYNRGKISLFKKEEELDTVNLGSSVVAGMNNTTNNLVNVVLNDSSRIQLSPISGETSIYFTASGAEDIFIVKAVNSCNVEVPVEGKIPVRVNPFSIIPLKVNNVTVCEGGEIELTYATKGGTIPENATYKLRFQKSEIGNVNEKRTFEVVAKRKTEGLLTAMIPDIPLRELKLYRIAILVDNPKLVSPYSSAFPIYEKPVATFGSQSDSVKIGENFSIGLVVTGPAPYTVELSNGNFYQLDQNLNVNIYAVRTDTFSIKSLKTMCGVTTDLPKQTLVLKVSPGIKIATPATQKRELCENQKVKLPFVSNVNLNSNTKFTVEGVTPGNTLYEFDAKLVNDSIEFFIPHSPSDWLTEGYFSINSFRIKTANPAYVSDYQQNFIIRGIPRVSYQDIKSKVLSGPQYFTYSLIANAGAPFDVVQYNGEQSWSEYPGKAETVFVSSSGSFAPKSVSNVCYSTTAIPPLDLTVKPYTEQAPTIVVYPPVSTYLCDTDSVEIHFEAFGKFDAGNQFYIRRTIGDEILLTVKSPGRYKLPVSTFGDWKYFFMQVSSTSPKIVATAGLPVILDSKPKLQNAGDYISTAEHPRFVGPNEIIYIPVDFDNQSPVTAVFSDGVENYTVNKITQYAWFSPNVEQGDVKPYTLKKATNACGTTDINLTTFIGRTEYYISLQYFREDHVYCAGEQLVLPFTLQGDTASEGTIFHLQISKRTGDFRSVATTTSANHEFKFTLPDTLEGEYRVRVAGGRFAESGSARFFVNKKPTASIAISDQYQNFPGEVSSHEPVMIDYNLTGGGPWLLATSFGDYSLSYSPLTGSFLIDKESIFELKSVSNQCGYGTVTGSVVVKVKPELKSLELEESDICSGNFLKVRYSAAGIPSGEKIEFYLTNADGARFELQSFTALTGLVSLIIPPDAGAGVYSLTCHITGSSVFENKQILISKVPDVQLTGQATINMGEFTYLDMIPKSRGNQTLHVTLSDGSEQDVPVSEYASRLSIKVSPTVTTTYTITSAEGVCGAAQFSGSAKVIVNPKSDRSLAIVRLGGFGYFCENDTIEVYYAQTGSFTSGNRLTVQLLDNNGVLLKNLTTIGNASPLRVVVAGELSMTDFYRLRLSATDANTASGDFQQSIQFGRRASASFASPFAYIESSGIAKGVVLLKGSAPWRYRYGNDLGFFDRFTSSAADTFILQNPQASASFKLLSVTNSCGQGIVNEPSVIKIEIVLAVNEPGSELNLINMGPNPTNGPLILNFSSGSKRSFSLYSVSGVRLWQESISQKETTINLNKYPAGIYLLKVEENRAYKIFKIIKQ